MINNVTIAHELKYLTMPEGILVDIDMINRYPKEKMTIITTGSVGAGFLGGLIAVIAFVVIIAAMMRKTNKELQQEYALSAKK